MEDPKACKHLTPDPDCSICNPMVKFRSSPGFNSMLFTELSAIKRELAWTKGELKGIRSDIRDILSYVRDLGTVKAETMAISKDLFAIKRDLLAEDRSSLLTTLREIREGLAWIRGRLVRPAKLTDAEKESKLERIRSVLGVEATFEGYVQEIRGILAE